MRKNAMNGSRNRIGPTTLSLGFTLVEVMVALIIVAMAVPALLMRMESMANSSIHNRTVTMAHWVAENRLVEVMLTRDMERREPRGREAGDMMMSGVKWDWNVETVDTKNSEFPGFEMTVRAAPQGQETMADLVVYLF
ncbi:MAG: type II secretion system protein GspI [Moraxellaceae bacterium]|nr:MAG: type II secretion system protein GspI [Moraxellaceae bacterium]